jgi:hypothetical protein
MCGVLALTLALVVSGVALAGKIRHEGSLVGVTGTSVKFAVKKKAGDLVSISNLRFQNIPVTCSDGTGGTISGEMPNFPVRGKEFTRRGPVTGPGINNGRLRVAGRFRRGGRVAEGQVRVSFKAANGAGCGTNDRPWKTTKA